LPGGNLHGVAQTQTKQVWYVEWALVVNTPLGNVSESVGSFIWRVCSIWGST
jgi:hypothetical protein